MGLRGWGSVAIVVPALLLAACDEPPAAIPASADQERCNDEVASLADDIQAFVDRFAGFSALDYASETEPADGGDLQELIDRRQRRLLQLDCVPSETQRQLGVELERVEGDGVIATAVADGLRAEVLGVPDRAPQHIEVSPGEDLAALALTATPGSTLELAAGDHEVSDPILVAQSLTIAGVGLEETRIISSADEAALVVLASGDLELVGLTLEHAVSTEGAVLLSFTSQLTLEDIRITGGKTAEDGTGGVGLLLTAAPVMGPTMGGEVPQLRAGSITRVEVSGNQGPGLVVQGVSAPAIVGAQLHDNGVCGICYLGSGGGSLRDSSVSGNEVGVVVAGSASPEVVGNAIADNRSDGILVEGRGRSSFEDNEMTGNGERGVTLTGSASSTFRDNRIVGNGEVGVALSEASSAELEGNEIGDHDVGVWVEGSAEATVAENEISGDEGVGLAVVGQGRVLVSGNRVVRNSLGIELRERARAELRDNLVVGSHEAAIVLRDAAQATGSGNRCEDVPHGVLTFDGSKAELAGPGCRHQEA